MKGPGGAGEHDFMMAAVCSDIPLSPTMLGLLVACGKKSALRRFGV